MTRFQLLDVCGGQFIEIDAHAVSDRSETPERVAQFFAQMIAVQRSLLQHVLSYSGEYFARFFSQARRSV